MNIETLESKHRDDLFTSLLEWIKNNDVVIVNLSTFYDDFTENHKAVICYYE